jgi:hypothetical protein
MEVKFRFTAWLLVTVIVFAALVVLTITLPKATVLGKTQTGYTPVPDSGAICGLLEALSITVIWPPEVAPAAVGLKSMPMTQPEFAASVPLTAPPATGQVVTALVSSTNGPPKTTVEIDNVLGWLFVSVIVLAALVVPTA